MTRESASKMFLVAAVFNWIIAGSLFFIPEALLNLFAATPTPEQSLWIQQFAGLVFVFGIGYYWTSRDFERNIQIVRMAIIGKSGVVLIGLLNVISGDVSWQFMLPASGDLFFIILFMLALKSRSVWKYEGMA
jgi:hypothetical protein